MQGDIIGEFTLINILLDFLGLAGAVGALVNHAEDNAGYFLAAFNVIFCFC